MVSGTPTVVNPGRVVGFAKQLAEGPLVDGPLDARQLVAVRLAYGVAKARPSVKIMVRRNVDISPGAPFSSYPAREVDLCVHLRRKVHSHSSHLHPPSSKEERICAEDNGSHRALSSRVVGRLVFRFLAEEDRQAKL